MADTVDEATRSRIMAGIRRKDTRPELVVRSELHRRGFRFRLQGRGLPGSPDLVLPKYGAVIFVHGCFWHVHGCSNSVLPKTRKEFWVEKLAKNKERDARKTAELIGLGWRVLVVWECSIRGKQANLGNVADKMGRWLKGSRMRGEIPHPKLQARRFASR